MAVATMEQTEFLTLTQAAADKLAAIMTEKGVRDTHALRVFVSGAGCSGLQYGMGFDANPRQGDAMCEQHGLRVVMDPVSLQYMTGAHIDYVEDPTSGGFQIENPNAPPACDQAQAGGAGARGGCSSCR
ncbi:MAG: iron-sulfur cluster assembly accessory protein [Chloroflexi bacterium]|nr:iron-sulfur cluster assembly accessory protein [Chloroflexota bacterium]